MKLTKAIALITASLVACTSASAIIVSGAVTNITPKVHPNVTPAIFAQITAATFVKLTVPFTESTPNNTVGNDNFESFDLYGFDEDQNVAVAVPGLTPEIGAFLPAGTIVASHYIGWDPILLNANPNQAFVMQGWVKFDANVLAVFTSTASLFASDYLANTGVTYLNPGARGLEAGNQISIDGGDPTKINVRWPASTPGDYVRVLTAFSPGGENPVPDSGTTVIFMGLGLLALISVRKWRAK
jgi:hypothetical protein